MSSIGHAITFLGTNTLITDRTFLIDVRIGTSR
jgi:hypothetical protein